MTDYSSFLTIGLMFLVFYFLLIRPEQKRKKQAETMRNNIQKGDKVTTIGGIVGTVVAINDMSLVLETSEDRVRVEVAKWAMGTNETQTEAAAAEKAAKKAKK